MRKLCILLSALYVTHNEIHHQTHLLSLWHVIYVLYGLEHQLNSIFLLYVLVDSWLALVM
jgi:hypothetical protein